MEQGLTLGTGSILQPGDQKQTQQCLCLCEGMYVGLKLEVWLTLREEELADGIG